MSVAPYHLHLPVMCKPVGVSLQGYEISLSWFDLLKKKGNFFCVSSFSKFSKEATSSLVFPTLCLSTSAFLVCDILFFFLTTDI